jgi:hypothetical protein
MTLLSELIGIPEQVHKSDFVISLASAIEEPERTVRDYVVTDQLALCFDRALSLVATSLADWRSKAAYLHASFGALGARAGARSRPVREPPRRPPLPPRAVPPRGQELDGTRDPRRLRRVRPQVAPRRPSPARLRG